MKRIGVFVGLLLALGFGTALPAIAQSPVEIEVRLTPDPNDDYLCWTPVRARARLVVAQTEDLDVVLRSGSTGPSTGAVGFMAADAEAVSRQNFLPQSELPVTLSANGEWTNFYVVGLRASDGGKDVAIRAELEDRSAIGQVLAMVRVRKNAEDLSRKERNAFLDVLADWKAVPGLARPTRFEDYYTTHDDAAGYGIHSMQGTRTSNFLPWHRAFLLNFERELQNLDPTVAVPYWKFDEPAPRLFAADFLGARAPDSNEVSFDLTNPLLGWATSDGVLLTRGTSGAARAAVSGAALPSLACTDLPCPDAFRAATDGFEMNYHNRAHSVINGWLNSGKSPRDPLFFLLHANVDRGWAHWQEIRGRYDATQAAAYTPVGTYPGSVVDRQKEGIYANDPMWPWGAKSGNWGTPGDPADDWLPYRFGFPAAGGFPLSPEDFPTPARMVDYMGVLGGPELGFCYDDIGFTGADPAAILEEVQ